jgi:hypothetical protein
MPYMIEVSPEYKDMAEDALKMAVVLGTGALVEQWRFGSVNWDNAEVALMSMLLGMVVFHYVVDKHVARVVVQDGQEGYYVARRRYH